MKDSELKKVVFDALNTAQNENQYDMQKHTSYYIAVDLATYCPDLEDFEPEQLEPIVDEWKESRKSK